MADEIMTDMRIAVGQTQEAIKALNERVTGALKRIDEQKQLTESVQQLALSVRELTLKQTQTDKNVDGLRRDLDELRGKPAKRWDAIIAALITATIAYIVGKYA